MKSTCRKCGRNFKVLAKGLCAYCYKHETGNWAKEFTAGVTREGNPGCTQPMKFRKTKKRNKKK